ncbi:hypothetical protein V6246_00820 [Algibacter sp. TI.3.09]|uniref:hypothetical protein n=1 Tax=Algibacter sp. TI.3.09 TaxID=3121298 RepID=UPI00311DEFEA
MNTEEFVKAFYTEKEGFLKEYLSENSKTEVGQLIKSLNLTDQQTEIIKKALDASFTDIFYTILLGLDGCTSIGDLEQQTYSIFYENNNQVCGGKLSGEIEGMAHEYFHELD